uniref:Secreted protein n=1 Tax=Ixodes ricinus TaxID=34613 RepID=A0A6B0TW07_IXORI
MHTHTHALQSVVALQALPMWQTWAGLGQSRTLQRRKKNNEGEMSDASYQTPGNHSLSFASCFPTQFREAGEHRGLRGFR